MCISFLFFITFFGSNTLTIECWSTGTIASPNRTVMKFAQTKFDWVLKYACRPRSHFVSDDSSCCIGCLAADEWKHRRYKAIIMHLFFAGVLHFEFVHFLRIFTKLHRTRWPLHKLTPCYRSRKACFYYFCCTTYRTKEPPEYTIYV